MPPTTPLTVKDFYEQGSEFCHQYSEQTMKIRLFSQQIIVGYGVAIAIFLTRLEDPATSPMVRPVLLWGGIIVFAFAITLALLNHHFSSAFRAIRDESLVPIESAYPAPHLWPWQAHQKVRANQFWEAAWYSPFLMMMIIAAVSFVAGLKY